MDGTKNFRTDVERPIAKPNFPLPVIFRSGMHAEMPTRKRRPSQKAHFFRRKTKEAKAPFYDFYITEDA